MCYNVHGAGTWDKGLSFIPLKRKAEKPPLARIQKISPVSYGVASLADTAIITFEVECCDLQVSQEVARICTQDNINLHLQRFRLPLVKVVAQAKILEPVFDKIDKGADFIASEAKVRIVSSIDRASVSNVQSHSVILVLFQH